MWIKGKFKVDMQFFHFADEGLKYRYVPAVAEQGGVTGESDHPC